MKQLRSKARMLHFPWWYSVGYRILCSVTSCKNMGPCPICILPSIPCVSHVAGMVKTPPANAGDIEMKGQSLDQEDPLEETMATHLSILAWRLPWIEEHGRLQSIGWHRLRHSGRDLAFTQALSLPYQHY